MDNNTDEVKGRIKEPAGTLTGDNDQEAEGKSDRVTGEVKGKIRQVEDKVEDLVDKVKDTLHHK
jgi:uncharacterized protein YjbJ (UPF0337 family)